jgi:hypothetical protein
MTGELLNNSCHVEGVAIHQSFTCHPEPERPNKFALTCYQGEGSNFEFFHTFASCIMF